MNSFIPVLKIDRLYIEINEKIWFVFFVDIKADGLVRWKYIYQLWNKGIDTIHTLMFSMALSYKVLV